MYALPKGRIVNYVCTFAEILQKMGSLTKLKQLSHCHRPEFHLFATLFDCRIISEMGLDMVSTFTAAK